MAGATLTSGSIVISSTSNPILFNKAKANLAILGSAKMEDDHHKGSDDGSGHK